MAAIVFDLDGTLVDSAPDLLAAANRVLAAEGASPLDLPTLTQFIGNGVPKLVERFSRARGLAPDDHARLVECFLDFYAEEPAERTRPYPGVVEALDQLATAGHRLGICTNKPEGPAREILAQLGLAGHFGTVVGGDTLPVKKPDPAPLHRSLADLDAAQAIYVGDSETDALTASAAGMPFLLFTLGYRKSAVEQIAHDHAFDDFARLPSLVAGML